MSGDVKDLGCYVTIFFDILDNNVGELQEHLDYQLKSDNWTLVSDRHCMYVKNNYIFSNNDDPETTFKEFSEDLQEIFSVSAKNLVLSCTSEEPFIGFAQISSFCHVKFSVKFSNETSDFTVTSILFDGYNRGVNQDLVDNFFS